MSTWHDDVMTTETVMVTQVMMMIEVVMTVMDGGEGDAVAGRDWRAAITSVSVPLCIVLLRVLHDKW